MSANERVAALDCGSNSTRLLIADAANEALFRDMRITRLSEGVDESRTLLAGAMQRSYDVLDEYRTVMDRFEVTRGLLVATSAVRDAVNGAQFLDEARRRTRVDATILNGREEATYSYYGATADLEPAKEPTIIVDVGGGSTELAMMFEGELASHSMQLGCVRVSERALGSENITPASILAAREMIDDELDRAWAAVPAFASVRGHGRLIGLAGTVATLAQMDAGIVHYDRDVIHHRRLSRGVVEQWRDQLVRETPAQRLSHPGMVRGREDVLPAGLYVLDAIMGRFGVDELLSSENDILNGITATLVG